MSYQDILYRPRHVSDRRASMPMVDRAAQFAPFAALTGHDGLIWETARLTEQFAELTDTAQTELDWVLQSLRQGMPVLVNYFLPDLRKEGGSYVAHQGILKKVDNYEKCLQFTDGTVVPFRFLAGLEIAG